MSKLEGRMTTWEDSLKQTIKDSVKQAMEGFRRSIIAEITKTRDKRNDDEMQPRVINDEAVSELKRPNPEQGKGTSCEKLKEGRKGTDSGFSKVSTNLVPSSDPSNQKLQATTTVIQVAGDSAALPPSPKPSLLAKPTRNTLLVNLASVETGSVEGGSQITQRSFAHKPPPKPPDSDLFVAAMETHLAQNRVSPAPPPEPPDTGPLEVFPPQPESMAAGQLAITAGVVDVAGTTAIWTGASLRGLERDKAAGSRIEDGRKESEQPCVKVEAAACEKEDGRMDMEVERESRRIGQICDLMGQAQVSLIIFEYEKEWARSRWKQQHGPVEKNKYWAQFSNEGTMGLMFSGPNSNSSNELETEDGLRSLETIIGCATVAEYQKRGQNFWNEFELYVADLLIDKKQTAHAALPSSVLKPSGPRVHGPGNLQFSKYSRKMFGAGICFGCDDSLVLPNGNYFLATTLVEIARKYVHGRIGDYESVAEWVSLHSSVLIRQWDPGEFHFPMEVTAYGYCWRCSLIFYGLINFVFDRGKIWEIQTELLPNFSSLNKLISIWFSSKLMPLPDARRAKETTSNLEDKVVFQGGGNDRTPDLINEEVIRYSRRDKGRLDKGK